MYFLITKGYAMKAIEAITNIIFVAIILFVIYLIYKFWGKIKDFGVNLQAGALTVTGLKNTPQDAKSLKNAYEGVPGTSVPWAWGFGKTQEKIDQMRDDVGIRLPRMGEDQFTFGSNPPPN